MPICLTGCPNTTAITCDGDMEAATEMTVKIQEAIDNADPGDTIWFTSEVPCFINDAIQITKPLTLTTSPPANQLSGKAQIIRIDKNDEGRYPACGSEGEWGSHARGAIFDIQSSDVTITDLRLIGTEYGPIGSRNTHGIWAVREVQADRLGRITIKDCELSGFRGRGIGLDHVEDFVIEGNYVERVGYSGIFINDGHRGRIHNNTVFDVANPTECDPPPGCQACNDNPNLGNNDFCHCHNSDGPVASTYGIVVGGCRMPDGVDDCSKDVIISSNTVKHNASWAGIMNHGGQRILVVDNLVEDTEILYGNTVSSPELAPDQQASSETWFVNNVGDIKPLGDPIIGRNGESINPEHNPEYDAWYNPQTHGIGQWFLGRQDTITQDIAAIGNVYKNCGFIWPVAIPPVANPVSSSCVTIYPANGVKFTHNELDGDMTTTYSVQLFRPCNGEVECPCVKPNDECDPGLSCIDDVCKGNVMEPVLFSHAVFAHNRFLHAYNYGIISRVVVDMILVTTNLMMWDDNAEQTNYGVWLARPEQSGTWDVGPGQGVVKVGMAPGVAYTAVDIQERTPMRPTVVAMPMGPGQVELRWDDYPDVDQERHDSFYIRDLSDSGFRHVAYRPPNDSRWTFDSMNPDYVKFDTLGYVVNDLEPGTHTFYLRAQSGSKFSAWDTVEVEVQ
jgi:hypothetical protein